MSYRLPDDPNMDEPEYPKPGELVNYLGEVAKVLEVWDTQVDAVPEWANEESDNDVLIVFDAGREKKPVPLRELAPFDNGDTERGIVTVDVDEAEWVGYGDDGLYVQAGPGPDGWYVTSIVDSDTAGYVGPFITDDGPHPTYAAALTAGVYAAAEHIICVISDISPISPETKKKMDGGVLA